MTKALVEKLKEKKAKLLEIYLALKNLQKLSLEDISSQIENFWAINYGLVVAIEAILDIGQIILSSKNKRVENYSQIIPELVKENILPKDFADRIVGMVNFRNIAIHSYLSLNQELVYKFLQENIDDFKIFLRHLEDIK